MGSERRSRSVPKKLGSRRSRSWFHLLVVIPGMILLGLLAWASSPAGNRWIARQAVQAMGYFLPGASLEVGELDTDVLRHLYLRRVRLLDEQGDPLVQLAELELVWQPLALLRGELQVDRLVLREPRVHLVVDPDGRVNLLEALGIGEEEPDPAAGPWEGSPIDVRIERAHLTAGRMELELESAEGPMTRVSLAGLEAALGFDLEGRELMVERAVLAARAGYQVGEGEAHWLPLGVGGSARLEDRTGGPPLQDLALEDLRLQLGSAVAGLEGRVAELGATPRLELELALRDLFPAELSFLTGELGIDGPFELEAGLEGPVEALELQATLRCPDDAGVLRVGLGANLASSEPSWRAHARLDAVQPHRFVEALPEPFLIQGGLLGSGRGLSWPDGMRADLGLALEPGVLWGVKLDGLSAKLGLDGGLVQVEQLAFASELGRASVQGEVEPVAARARLGFSANGVPLAGLADFGVFGLSGVAAATGSATIGFGEDGLQADLAGRAEIARAGYGDLVSSAQLISPFSFGFHEGASKVEGVLVAREIASQGARVARADGPWRFELTAEGAMAWQAQIVTGGLSYGVLRVAEARAAVGGGLPVGGELLLELDFDALDLRAPSSVAPELRAERAAGRLVLEGDRLRLKAQAKEGERPVLQAELELDLASGRLVLPSLLVAPTADTAWRSVEPVRATLVDGGLQEMMLQLRSDQALLWGMGSFDPNGPVDLRLMVSDLTLDPLVPLFPGLPRGLRGTTRLALQVGGSADAMTIAGSAEVEDLVLPGAVRDLDARLVLDGDGEVLAFRLDVPEPPVSKDALIVELPGGDSIPVQPAPAWASASLLFAEGRIPLGISAAGVRLARDEPWELDLLVAPGDIRRIGGILEIDALPEARASAHLVLGGTPAATTLRASGAAELPLGEDRQRVRVELDLLEEDGRAELEVVVAQHMLRQAEVIAAASTGLPRIIAQQSAEAFGAPGPPGPPLALDDLRSWVSELDASLVPLGISTGLLAQLVPIPQGLEGELVGGLRIAGDPLRPELAGALQLVDASAGEVGLAPALVSLSPARGGYQVGLNLGFVGGGSLLASGFAPLVVDLERPERIEESLSAPGLELELSGEVPLEALLALAVEAQEVAGMLEIEGGVRGSLLDPEADLDLILDGGGMTLPELGVRYSNLLLRGGVRGKLVQLDELRVRATPSRGGFESRDQQRNVIELGGSAMLDGWVPTAVDIQGVADRFWAIDTNKARLAFSGDFELAGGWPALELGGQVKVDDARFVLDKQMFLYSGTLDLDPRLRIERSRQKAVVREIPKPPFYQHMVVDLEVDLARATTVQVEMPFDDTLGALYANALTIVIETRLDGVLEVGFSELQPAVLGEVRPVWGRADIIGARFALGEGIISFVGGDPFDPILRLEAVHGTTRYGEVAVDITGSLADMGLAFRSDEYPDETDIVSILLTGVPLSSGENGAGVNAALYNAALGAVMGQLENQGGGGHLVDMVELEAAEAGSGRLIESAKAGRAFGDDIFVTLAYSPGAEVDEGENITEITVDWTISRRWNAEFVTGDQGTSSADLYWTWRF